MLLGNFLITTFPRNLSTVALILPQWSVLTYYALCVIMSALSNMEFCHFNWMFENVTFELLCVVLVIAYLCVVLCLGVSVWALCICLASLVAK